MERRKHGRMISLISMLLAWIVCFGFLTEHTAAGAENAPVPEETDAAFADELIGHRLWGFFMGWTEEDIYRMLGLCSPEWRKGREDPAQDLREILGPEKPCGYKINSISGKDGDPVIRSGITVVRETDGGGYRYALYEITWYPDPDGFYAIDPEGFRSAVPAEPAGEEDLVMLTPEGIMRSCLSFHEDEENLYDKLIPVNLSVEKRGIRVDVISGCIREGTAWFLISLQDPEGRFSKYDIEPSFTMIENSYDSYRWMELYHDRKENRSFYAVSQDLKRQLPPGNRITVGVSEIWLKESETVNLIPLLKQYGKAEKGIRPPKTEDSHDPDMPAVPDDFRVLDYTRPLDIPLFRDVSLTGIGWIRDQLHIQFHNKGRAFVEMSHGRGSACVAWASASVCGRSYTETDVEYSPLDWDGNNDGWTDWSEYVFNCKPEEAEQVEAYAEITITAGIMEDHWDVQVPLDLIRAADDPQ